MPTRPDSVPEHAIWDANDQEWVVQTLDTQGRDHGQTDYYRADGRLCCTSGFEHGTLHGKNMRFHPDGSVASEGEYEHGVMTSVHHYRGDESSTESFPEVCQNVTHIFSQLSNDGKYTKATQFFGKDDVPLTSTGDPLPPRPENVPALAGYLTQWVLGELDRSRNNQKVGTWKYWTTEGQLVCEEEISYEGVAISTVHYFENGSVEKSYRHHQNGKRAEWLWYHDNGQLFVDEKSDEEGNVLYKARWSDNGTLREEVKSTYDADGLVNRTEYDEGDIVLQAKRNDKELVVTLLQGDGKTPEAMGAIVGGYLVGPWKLYEEDGSVRRTIETSGLEIEANPVAEKMSWPLRTAAYQLEMKDAGKLEELAGVEGVNWEEVESAYGDTEDFPAYLRGLVLDEPYARRYAFGQLYGEIEHQNTVYEATAQVIPFLAKLLSHPNCDRQSIVSMLYDVGSCAAPWAEEAAEWEESEQISILGTLNALDEAWPSIWALMPTADAELRQQIVLLGQFPSDAQGVVQKALLDFVVSDETDELRACAVNALAHRNGATPSTLVPVFADTSPLIRTTAAIACGLCFGPENPPEIHKALQDSLEQWESIADRYRVLPFVEGHVLALLALSAACTANSDVRATMLEPLRDLLEEVDAISATTFGRGLLSLTFGRCEKPFAPSFVDTIETLAKSKQFFDFNVNAHEMLDKWALPTEPEDLLELVATLRQQEDPEEFLHALMHGEE